MKKIILLLAFTFLGTSFVNAQEVSGTKKSVKKETKKNSKSVAATKVATATIEGAGIVFESETIDFGTITKGADGNREFVFTNNGNKPLVISNAQGSCGCTVPTTPKDPIAPGEKSKIGVHYDTNRPGAFTKTVTVTSNAVGSESKVLTIKGTVIEEAPAVSPLTPKS